MAEQLTEIVLERTIGQNYKFIEVEQFGQPLPANHYPEGTYSIICREVDINGETPNPQTLSESKHDKDFKGYIRCSDKDGTKLLLNPRYDPNSKENESEFMLIKNHPFIIPHYQILEPGEEEGTHFIAIDQCLGDLNHLLGFLKLENYGDKNAAVALQGFINLLEAADYSPNNVFVFDACIKMSVVNFELTSEYLDQIDNFFKELKAIPVSLKIKEFNLYCLNKYFISIDGDLERKFYNYFHANAYFKEWLKSNALNSPEGKNMSDLHKKYLTVFEALADQEEGKS
jgi:hypothetical protein